MQSKEKSDLCNYDICTNPLAWRPCCTTPSHLLLSKKKVPQNPTKSHGLLSASHRNTNLMGISHVQTPPNIIFGTYRLYIPFISHIPLCAIVKKLSTGVWSSHHSREFPTFQDNPMSSLFIYFPWENHLGNLTMAHILLPIPFWPWTVIRHPVDHPGLGQLPSVHLAGSQ